jgi:predicted metalloprotease with PDZ domain
MHWIVCHYPPPSSQGSLTASSRAAAAAAQSVTAPTGARTPTRTALLRQRDRGRPTAWLTQTLAALLAMTILAIGSTLPATTQEPTTQAPDTPATPPSRNLQLRVDARDLPRKLVSAEIIIPLSPNNNNNNNPVQRVALWYPKWIPGSHGPGGPIANVAGLRIEDAAGQTLAWRRTPGEVYRIEVELPAATEVLRVHLKYIANQPTTGSTGHDCFGSPLVGLINLSPLLLYPEGADIDVDTLAVELQLPAGWSASTALNARSTEVAEARTVYEAESLRTVVDSPILCGKYRRIYTLDDDAARAAGAKPHRLHVFSETTQATELPEELLVKFRSMVAQTALLTGSQPFEHFDILLAATDALPQNGLEHARSSLNVLPRRVLRSTATLKGWARLLIPHEYLHAWCGKYRQPAGMIRSDFHSPMDTELLWVYEGLTQYLGEVVEARCGLMTTEEFRQRLNVELRAAKHQQGRQWRPLSDTAAASHLLRGLSDSWPGLRRSQDYYMEGALFWLEADAIIRDASGGQHSLDDFCRGFFAFDADAPHPRGFERQEIIDRLAALAPTVDWHGLVRRRVESPQADFDATVAERIGYRFHLTSQAPPIPDATFHQRPGVDAYDSLGMFLKTTGEVADLLLDSPADRARLSPGMRILGVNDRTWSPENLAEALATSRDQRPIELLIADADVLRTIQLHYYDGPKFWTLEKPDDAAHDLLLRILHPR